MRYARYAVYPPNKNFVGIPIGSMYGIYANIWGILMVNDTIYSIHGSYGIGGALFLKLIKIWKDHDKPLGLRVP